MLKVISYNYSLPFKFSSLYVKEHDGRKAEGTWNVILCNLKHWPSITPAVVMINEGSVLLKDSR